MRRDRTARSGRIAVALIAVSALAMPACKEEGTVQVSSLTFEGNSGIDDATLKSVVATQANGMLPFSKHHYFDRAEFDRDVQRIEAYYADHGYPDAKVVGTDAELNQAKDRVAITIRIAEGEPIIVDAVSIEGMPDISAPHRRRLEAQLPVQVGQPRNQTDIIAAHGMMVGELRDHGYPYGTVDNVEKPGSSPRHVAIAFIAKPGPHSVFGSIAVEGNASVGEDVIRRELLFHEGDEYRLGQITESQRRLYALELFQFANITPDLRDNRPVRVPVVVTVAESKHRKLQLAVGYGSEEKARARANWKHVNFTGGARSLDTEAKWSSLEQGFRATFTEPYFFRPGLSARLQGSTWWSSEPTYTYRSRGGRAIFTKEFGRGPAGIERGHRSTLRATVINEYESYAIAKEALDDPTLTDDFIALGLNPDTGEASGRLAGVALDFDRDTSGQPLDPRRGYLVSAHVESADSLLGGSFRYTELLAEGRKYFRVGPKVVWASRLRAGTLAGGDSSKIPFFKRYFAGGSTSVRGWGRYEISPLSESGVPLGGRSLMEMSSEVRFAVSGSWSGVLFVDGGSVAADPWKIGRGGMRWAVGPGLRYNTRIGPLRVDFGKQLNPIPGLLINGNPEKRKWRVHFSIGQAF